MPMQLDRWPTLPTRWATYRIYDKSGNPTGESLEVQIKRVLSDNFDMFRIVEALSKDQAALPRWIKKLADEVVMDWKGLLHHDAPEPCTHRLDCAGCAKVEPTSARKEQLLLADSAFPYWVWREAIDMEGFRGNSNGVAALPDGGELVAV